MAYSEPSVKESFSYKAELKDIPSEGAFLKIKTIPNQDQDVYDGYPVTKFAASRLEYTDTLGNIELYLKVNNLTLESEVRCGILSPNKVIIQANHTKDLER